MSEKIELARLAKIIANREFCSRRLAEDYILDGRVAVNGRVTRELAEKHREDIEIRIDGKILNQNFETRMIILNKPNGYICSRTDPENRPIIYDLLPDEFQNFKYVGRLDFNSEGLLLLTNESKLKTYLEHPDNNFTRIYVVKLYGILDIRKVKEIEKNGLLFEGKRYKIDKINVLRESKLNHQLEFYLKEGKNREVRNICSALNLQVKKLQRVKFAEFELGNLGQGKYREVPENLLRKLRWK